VQTRVLNESINLKKARTLRHCCCPASRTGLGCAAGVGSLPSWVRGWRAAARLPRFLPHTGCFVSLGRGSRLP